PVAPHRLAAAHRMTRHLVPGLDVGADLDGGGPVGQHAALRQLPLGDGDVVLGAQQDGAVGQGDGRHGAYYTLLICRTAGGSVSSCTVVWSMPKRACSTAWSVSSSRSLWPTSSTTPWALIASRPEVSVHTCRSCTRRTPATASIAASISASSRCGGVPSSRTFTAWRRSPQVRG